MSLRLDRNRIFALISALEEDLRGLIDLHLLSSSPEETIFGPAYERALSRYRDDPSQDLTQASLLYYLDLGDEIEILNRYRSSLPDSVAEAMAQTAEGLTKITSVRNRVMHGRPLLPDDSETVERPIRSLTALGFDFFETRRAINRLESEPNWAPAPPPSSSDSKILHNLPLPDFDETGLIGRRKDVEKLTRELLRMGAGGRNPAITVVGPGGLGKTALVVQTLSELVDNPECPFELISWVSLKIERLTATGVAQVVDAVKSLEQALPILADVLDPSLDSLESLAAALEDLGARTLIVIDNLETVSGDEVLELIDSLPDSVSYLFTSREGIGQVEKLFNLGPLDQRGSAQLLRGAFRARGILEFAAMTESDAISIVERLGNSPLGIKWFVSGIEVGHEASELLDHQEDLVAFCVKNVFEASSEESKAVGRVLAFLDHPLTLPEIREFLPEFDSDTLRRSVRSLQIRTLIQRQLLNGLTESYEASPLLKKYVDSIDNELGSESSRIRAIDDAARRSQERIRIEAEGDPLRPNVLHGATDHRGVASLLLRALDQSRSKDFDGSMKDIDTAEELDPEYWEVYRVRGFVLSQSGKTASATRAYERAIELSPNDHFRAIVQHFFAGHLMRMEMDSIRAEVIARESHEILQLEKSAYQLGLALTYVQRYDEAERYLRDATKSLNPQSRIIAVTQLVDTLRRQAEHDAFEGREPAKAVNSLNRAFELIDEKFESGMIDSKLAEKGLSVVSEYFNIVSRNQNLGSIEDISAAVTRANQLRSVSQNSRSIPYLQGNLRRLISVSPSLSDDQPEISQLLDNDQNTITESAETSHLPRRNGIIRTWNASRLFGIIEILGNSDSVFTHISGLIRPSDGIYLAAGTKVTFTTTSRQGRLSAVSVLVEDHSPDLLKNRMTRVRLINQENGYMFANDTVSGVTVFVSRQAFDDPNLWEQIEVGSLIRADIEIDSQDRFRAASRSASLA